jgi:ParB/RepB/Spo0J family partition protein
MDWSTADLRPHELNERIYGDRADADLVRSVQAKGILNPLLIASDGRIISGHRRWGAAQAAGLTTVPVVVFGSDDEQDIAEALIESNRQRIKSGAIVAREAAALAEIERERAKARSGTRTDLRALLHGGSRTDVVVAGTLGIGQRTAADAIAVGNELRRLESSPDAEDQERARQIADVAERRGIKPAVDLIVKPSVSDARQTASTVLAPATTRATFNRTNNNVDWAWWTWNPVTGCLHGCQYCYAREIAHRFYPQGFEPTFHEDRLTAPANTAVPKSDDPRSNRVFTCSMADLFGKWVPQAWVDAVFEQVKGNPQWAFLFLTKFPQRLAELNWPANAWVGTSVDQQHRVAIAEKALRGVQAGVKWLSVEPMLEPLRFTSLDMFDWVVIGAQSSTNQPDGVHVPAFMPELDWVTDLLKQAADAGCEVFIKDNLLPLLRREPRGHAR